MQHGVKGLCYMTKQIEDINIFSSAFLAELRGVAQLTWWLSFDSPLYILSVNPVMVIVTYSHVHVF